MESPDKNEESIDRDGQIMETSDSLEHGQEASEHNSEHGSQTEMTTCQTSDVDNISSHSNDQEILSNPSAESSRSHSPELDRSSCNMDTEDSIETQALQDDKTMEGSDGKHPSFSKDNLAEWILHIKDNLTSEHKILKENHFKDYDNLASFKDLVSETNEMCTEYEEQIMTLCGKMKEVREVLNSLQATIDKKLVEEGLLSWLGENRAHPAGEWIGRGKQNYTL